MISDYYWERRNNLSVIIIFIYIIAINFSNITLILLLSLKVRNYLKINNNVPTLLLNVIKPGY